MLDITSIYQLLHCISDFLVQFLPLLSMNTEAFWCFATPALMRVLYIKLYVWLTKLNFDQSDLLDTNCCPLLVLNLILWWCKKDCHCLTSKILAGVFFCSFWNWHSLSCACFPSIIELASARPSVDIRSCLAFPWLCIFLKMQVYWQDQMYLNIWVLNYLVFF